MPSPPEYHAVPVPVPVHDPGSALATPQSFWGIAKTTWRAKEAKDAQGRKM